MRWVGKVTVVLLLFLNVFLLFTHGESVLRPKDLHGTRNLVSQADEDVKSCRNPSDCEYPLECPTDGVTAGKCVLKSCKNPSDCDYPLQCGTDGATAGKCVLKSCTKPEDCEHPLKCDNSSGMPGKCVHLCTNNPCINGGTCVMDKKSFKCICPDPFSGDTVRKIRALKSHAKTEAVVREPTKKIL
ncbi:hypothetical protein HNY73_014466 [Argiope bruennichi]|uniref:EGF-like domain-containing protein n=1 Tax=Argiope bruennichi TaxID=94029 RepID=A0A8T0EQ73_ARGBR|nr:hypothetical protein HNY73_014466 [Argiope bruennichi]